MEEQMEEYFSNRGQTFDKKESAAAFAPGEEYETYAGFWLESEMGAPHFFHFKDGWLMKVDNFFEEEVANNITTDKDKQRYKEAYFEEEYGDQE
ncbi:hypothetical protein IMZ31_24230 (plasmid) [Pontibacillus sp. ALD_SL1]|uniref:hypothetical protein n=1 Tax=Pontibacillus sp. ALD_SL1 TaxID=2777185 RepID=UPI001A96A8E9|nr:hypothetical protein [Pontibacillus sp. ALD_SL1]QST02561.1 hypothetical protein IMZ31_24230 [Pontibacillus sp. ALD_SL1]